MSIATRLAGLMTTESGVELEHIACNLCGEDDVEYLYSREGRLTGHPFRLVRCRSCGLYYLNPRLRREGLMELYDREYYHGAGFDEAVNYVDEYHGEETKADIEFHTRQLSALLPAGASVLDVGCGTGAMLRELETRGFAAEGIEPSPFASGFAREQGHEVRTGDFIEEHYPDNSFDAVVSIEVIEHVYDPMEFLRNVRRVLKPGGVFYYTTGNFDGFRLQRRLLRRAIMDSYVTPEGHITFFTSATLTRYFAAAGFGEAFLHRCSGAPRESAQLTALFRRLRLLRCARVNSASPFVRGLYNGMVRLFDPVFRPALPLARK